MHQKNEMRETNLHIRGIFMKMWKALKAIEGKYNVDVIHKKESERERERGAIICNSHTIACRRKHNISHDVWGGYELLIYFCYLCRFFLQYWYIGIVVIVIS